MESEAGIALWRCLHLITYRNDLIGMEDKGIFTPLARLHAPQYMENDTVRESEGMLAYTDTYSSVDPCILRVTRTVTSGADRELRLQLVFSAETCFAPDKYTIPCIMYDGNEWGSRNSPKGLTHEGKPWVFAYDRCGIPSCTVTENARYGFAMFASDENESSLRSSCSLVRDGCEYIHRIIYPVVEAPVSYSGKNKMTPRYDEYITLQPGESFTASFYLFVCVPEWKEYACAALLDHISAAFPYRHQPVLGTDEVWRLGIAYLTKLIHDYNGKTLIIAGYDTKLSRMEAGHMGQKMTTEDIYHYMAIPEYNQYGFNREIYEIGWAGQGFLSTRMLMTDAFERGDEALVDKLIGSLHNWTDIQRENGMVLSHYERYAEYEKAMQEKGDDKAEDPCQGWYPDVCNLGWGATEMSKIYTLLKAHGREHSEFLRFATRICDFFTAHFDENTGFGKLWSLDGQSVDTAGTVGGFMITALIDTWRVTGNAAYLETAKRGSDFYYARDLEHFRCTAGAIDCQSIDKETAYPFVVSSLDLYEITGEDKYLTRARMAAYYFYSWAFQYDVLYPDTADFVKYGYFTSGGTAISAEHHAIDPWGALLCSEYVRLAKHTGDDRWIQRAKMMWNNSLYGITTDENAEIHGLKRPLGSQNEGFFQARWTKYRPTCEERGHFNDWLVSWVTCWRLTTLDRMRCVVGVNKALFDKD